MMIQQLQWKTPHLKVTCRTTQWSQWSQPRSRIFTESKGITPNLHWQDQDQNLTRSKQEPSNATSCKNNQQSMGCKGTGDLCDSNALQWLKIFQHRCSFSPKHLGPHPDHSWQTNSQWPELLQLSIPFHAIWESCHVQSSVWGCVLGRGKRPSMMSAQFIPKCKPHWAVEHDNKNLLT